MGRREGHLSKAWVVEAQLGQRPWTCCAYILWSTWCSHFLLVTSPESFHEIPSMKRFTRTLHNSNWHQAVLPILLTMLSPSVISNAPISLCGEVAIRTGFVNGEIIHITIRLQVLKLSSHVETSKNRVKYSSRETDTRFNIDFIPTETRYSLLRRVLIPQLIAKIMERQHLVSHLSQIGPQWNTKKHTKNQFTIVPMLIAHSVVPTRCTELPWPKKKERKRSWRSNSLSLCCFS